MHPDSRVALDGVGVGGDGGGGRLLGQGALEEGVAVGVAVLVSAHVRVEGVGGRAGGKLLRPDRLRCRERENAGRDVRRGWRNAFRPTK